MSGDRKRLIAVRLNILSRKLVPTVLAVIWFTTFGGTALDIEMSGAYPLADVATSEVELTLFYMLEQLPLTTISSILAIIVVGIFFVTSADSAAFVLGSMTSGGKLNPSFKLSRGNVIRFCTD